MTFARLFLLTAGSLLAVISPLSIKADTLLTNHFDYPTGDTLGTNGWTLIASSGGRSTLVVSSNLSYTGFAQSSGNAVQLRANGQDFYKTYTTQTYTTNDNASLYYSFMLRVGDLGTLDATGSYFAGLAQTNGASLGATVAIRLSGTGFQLGIGKRDTLEIGSYSWSETVFDINQTILVVGSYNLVAGAINNDTASLWLNPLDSSFGQSNAPTATLTNTGTGVDLVTFGSFTLKPQGTSSTAPTLPASLIFDELRVGNTWADVTPFLQSIWGGQGTNANWGTAGNWTNGLVPTNGTPLVFAGSNGLSSTNNLVSFSTASITFATNAAPFNVAGNAVTLTGSIINQSTNVQTISLDLTLSTNSTINSGNSGVTMSGVLGGTGGLTKSGDGTLTLSHNNAFSGGTTLSAGTLRLASATAAGTGTIAQSSEASTLQIDTAGTVTNAMSIYNISMLQSVTLSGNKTLNNTTYTVADGTTTTDSGNLSGTGGVTKKGAGTLILTGSNSYTGAVAVNAGLLNLNSSTGGAAASTGSVSVASGATLLISQSNQVNDSAAVTLSGGTIQRDSGVSEVFGSLNLAAASFLDYGSGTEGTLTFGAYTPSALLTVNNFFEGNKLVFASDLSSAITNSSYFNFDNAFTYNWSGSAFTITAIPEPSVCVAVVGLLGLMLWPACRRRLHQLAPSRHPSCILACRGRHS